MPEPEPEPEPVAVPSYVESTEVLTVATDGTPTGMTTYRLVLTLGSAAANIYSIFGSSDGPLDMPPAWNYIGMRLPGADANIGGQFVDEVLMGGATGPLAGVGADSYVTVGATSGNLYPNDFEEVGKRGTARLGSAGTEDIEGWSGNVGIYSENGAVFWLDPVDGPTSSFPDNMSGNKVVVAQLTVPTGLSFTALVNAQGRKAAGDDWRVVGLTWSV